MCTTKKKKKKKSKLNSKFCSPPNFSYPLVFRFNRTLRVIFCFWQRELNHIMTASNLMASEHTNDPSLRDVGPARLRASSRTSSLLTPCLARTTLWPSSPGPCTSQHFGLTHCCPGFLCDWLHLLLGDSAPLSL